MKNKLIFFFIFFVLKTQAQCGISDACNINVGIFSNNVATDIAYDNMGSAFHSTYIKETNSIWKVWGENMGNDGVTNILSPQNINATNYPALTGTIYKMGLGSSGAFYQTQLIVLTSTGLFALGAEGFVLDYSITNSTVFQKITVNGKQDGLPANISPADVKMLFVTSGTIIITTCVGEVFVLALTSDVRGDGGNGNAAQWSRVMENATTPLTNVIVARGDFETAFALKSDGTLWTWGSSVFLGDGTSFNIKNYATQMTLPAGLSGVKMIQATHFDTTSYYILSTDRKLFVLGENQSGQLGDNTTVERTNWVNALNPDNSIINDAAWISANEHDDWYDGFAVIKSNGVVLTSGTNSRYMVGRTVHTGINFLDVPNGITATDIITFAETGGHTCSLIKKCGARYGYVGHRVNGSIGDGSSNNVEISSYDFNSPPIINVCGTEDFTTTITTNSPICPNQNAVFTIHNIAGNTISYNINGGATQTIVIGTSNTAVVTIPNAASNQTLNLILLTNASGNCMVPLTTSATIQTGIIPIFNQAPAVCVGGTIAPLPTTSINGFTGSWSPALNNSITTIYTFMPTAGQCSNTTQMTIAVNSANVLPTFNSISPICSGNTIASLPTTSLNNIVGTWQPALNNTATKTYTFTPTAGQCAINKQLTISVIQRTNPTFTQVAPICEGEVLNNLPTQSNNGIIGTWTPPLNNMATTTYTFTPTSNFCANPKQMTITVNQKITPTFTAIAPICEGTVLAPLPTNSNNGFTGSWSPALNNMATTTYTFSPNEGQCGTNFLLTITVNPKIIPTFNSLSPICFGGIAPTLPAVSLEGISGYWQPLTINNTQSSTYQFTPNPNQCTNIPPPLSFTVEDDFDFEIIHKCIGNSYTLQIVPINNSFDINSSNFNWTNNSNFTISGNSVFDITNYLKTNNILPQFPMIYNASVILSNGCSKKHSTNLFSTFCEIQKGISPNNDPYNEFFDLRLMNVKQLKIFNRYGLNVYTYANYTDQWKGQNDAGDELPDGVYYYVIAFNENKPTVVGWIYINRER